MKIINNTNSSIVDEFLQLCEASDKNRTLSPLRKRALRNCEKSPQDEFDTATSKIVCTAE